MSVRRQLLGEVVDFAGTYPPAALTAARAVAAYAAALHSPHSWMLGRLVWPAAGLGELSHEVRTSGLVGSVPWRVSAVLGADASRDLAALRQVGAGEPFIIDALEARASSDADVALLERELPENVAIYVEVAFANDPRDMLSVLQKHHWFAKMRTGGVTPDAFSAPQNVLRFVQRCVELDVQFKATAGLHHPIRGDYPLTYEPGCPRETMFGFLNLLFATAFLERGDDAGAARVLEDREAGAFTLADDRAAWRDRELTRADVGAARRRLHSFGSCSFEEPVDDLTSIGAVE